MGGDGDVSSAKKPMNRAERKAEEVLARAGVARAPVPVEMIARKAGAKVRYRDFDGDISGLLVRDDGGEKIISVHSRQAKVRQRFTIAHELGHLMLHKGNTVIVEQLWRGARVNWREGASSGVKDDEEIEANQFAAALLMPARLVERDYWAIADRATSEDSLIDQLARRYHVSTQSMRFRLLNLALIDPS